MTATDDLSLWGRLEVERRRVEAEGIKQFERDEAVRRITQGREEAARNWRQLTTNLAPLPPSPTKGLDWAMRMECVRHAAMLELNGHITAPEADRRVARHANRDLTDEDRNQAYEDLKDRLGYLSWLHSDDFDPCQFEPENRDLETLAGNAEDDIEHHLRQLVGPRPVRS